MSLGGLRIMAQSGAGNAAGMHMLGHGSTRLPVRHFGKDADGLCGIIDGGHDDPFLVVRLRLCGAAERGHQAQAGCERCPPSHLHPG